MGKNVTLHGNLAMSLQVTIIGAIQVPQITGVGDASVEGFPTKSPTHGAGNFDATSGHYKRLS